MRKIYSEGDIEFVGPYRVMHIWSQGVHLRELKTGVAMSCDFKNIRKLNYEELLRFFPLGLTASLSKFLEELEPRNNIHLGDKKDHNKEENSRMCNVSVKEIAPKLRGDVIKASWIGRKKCNLLKIEPKSQF